MAVHTIQFSSADPFDHVCRVLDTIRKMGFDFASLNVGGAAGNAYRISVSFQPRGELTPDTLAERISSCVGVYDLTHSTDCADARRT